jgi:serine/threonine protein kinase/tetratricopeptide (TPR) repeat protein
MALPIGTILDGKFKIVQVLGEGGMGTVYKVEQAGAPGSAPYHYAVKELLISPNVSEEDRRTAIDRFNKEIELLRSLKHPRIPSLMLPFQERGNYYFVMEFVPGRSLEKMLEDAKGPLPEEQVIKWAMQVCEALTYIHTRVPPIILRDLKPGNIMVTPDGDARLIDFGIARRFNPNKQTNTENLGTISYASPEHLGSITAPGQKRSAQNPGQLVQTDARSDIYSLGATMYHLLTNYEPDPIQTPPQGTILAKNPRLRTIQVGGRIICPVEQVIIKAMQQNPAQRFQSAEAMRMALYHCLPNASAVPATTIQVPAMSANATLIVPAPVSSAVGLVCPKCGLQNRPGAKFCKRDGQPLLPGATVVPPQMRSQVPPRAGNGIQARPIQARPAQPIQARPAQQPIQPRPAQQPIQPRPASPIQARPVTQPAATATAIDPATAQRLGLQHFGKKEYAQAINMFKLAQNGVTSYDTLYNLGRAYRQYGQTLKETDKKQAQENLTLAAEQLEAATRLRPDGFDAHFQLGMCYRDMELYTQASTVFKKALALAPRDTALYYQLGMVAMEQGYNREAEAYFLDGLKINPDHALILIALGRLYIKTKQTRAAISTLQQATNLDSTLWEGWLELGRAHMDVREWKLALSALEQARQCSPYTPEIYSAMAACYLKMNKKAEARKMVNETLQRDPNNAEALRLQKQL